MSLQLWIYSFDWNAFEKLSDAEIADLLYAEIECERDCDPNAFDTLPASSNELRARIVSMVQSNDWYANIDDTSLLDTLLWSALGIDGFLGSAIHMTATQPNGLLIETADVGRPYNPREAPTESYYMGQRRFKTRQPTGYFPSVYDDPEYSVHDPAQVAQIRKDISFFDYRSYPDPEVSQNFAEDLLGPIERCVEKRLAIHCRWS